MPITILLIDDDARVLQTFARSVRLAGYTVLTAAGGAEGLELYHQEQPDITLTDLRMPRLSGLQVLQAIRERDPEANVLLVSGHGDQDAILEAMRAGASDFLPKPVDQVTLESALRRASERIHLKRELRASQEALRQQNAELEATVRARTAELERELEERKQIEAARQKAERDLKLIFDTVPALIWQKDSAGVYVQVNRAYCETVGLTEAEIIGKTDTELFPPEIADKYRADDLTILHSGHPQTNIEEYHQKSSGEYGWSRTEKTLYYDTAGQVIGTIGFAIDITKRKQMEEALREREENFRKLAEHAQALISIVALVGNETRYLYVNQEWERVTGHSRTDLDEIKPLDMVHPEMRAVVLANAQKRVAGQNAPDKYELKLLTKTGETRILDFSALPIEYEHHNAILTTAIDITARKQMEAALRENMTRYRRAQQLGHVGNWEYNLQTREFWGSEEAKRIYGFPPETEWFTTEAVERCIPERERVHQALLDLIERDQEYRLEFDILTRDTQERRTLLSVAELERDAAGQPWKVTGVVQDITARKRVEETLRAREAHYRLLAEHTVDVIWVMDVEAQQFTYISPSVEQLRGYTPAEIMAQPVDAALTPESARKVAELLAIRIPQFLTDPANPIRAVDEVDQPHKNGAIVHTEVTTTIWRNPAGRLEVIGVSRDITAHKQMEDALRESEARIRLITDHTSDSIWAMDTELHFTYQSPAAERLFGYTVQEWQTLDWNVFVHPADMEAVMQVFESLQSQRADNAAAVIRVRHKDGRELWVEFTASAIRGETGDLTQIVGVTRDITARQQAEAALQKNIATLRRQNELVSALLENLQVGVFMIEAPSGKPLIANPAAEKLLGKGIADADKNTLAEVYNARKVGHPEPYPVEELPIVRGMVGESTSVDDMVVDRPDGTEIRLEVFGAPIKDEHGAIWASLISFQDITARKQTEEMLQATVQLAQMRDSLSSDELIANGLEEGVRLTHSAIGYCHFFDAEQNAIALYAWSAGAQQECQACKHAAHYPLDQAGLWADCIRQGGPVIHNDYARAPGKRGLPEGHIPLTRHLSVPVWQGDQIVAVLGVGNKPQDYTPADTDVLTQIANTVWLMVRRQRAEAQLQEYADHLAQLVQEKVRQLAQEQAKVTQLDKLASLGQLATSVAHELRQPLAAITLDAGYLIELARQTRELRARGAETALDLAELEHIGWELTEDVKRAQRIIDHLRNFGRIAAEETTLVNLNQPLENSFILIGAQLRDHKVTVDWQLTEALPLIQANPYKLEQVFLNLIANAEYAMQEAAEQDGRAKVLTLSTRQEGDRVVAEVRDNGCGMSEAARQHLFEPFFTTKPEGHGTGLGLSICRDLVAEFGGEITCQSTLGEGTAFTLRFPVTK